MKISKSLLKTIAAGLVVAGTLNSCGIHDDAVVDLHGENCTEKCDINHAEQARDKGETSEHNWEDCPGCGMG